MNPFHTGEVTRLLVDMQTGSKDAEARLLAVLYDELRRLASSYLRRERPDHTLQPTALVHEAYLRLVEQSQQNWQNRAHFLAVSAHVMRQILVDHARQRKAAKRGGQERPLPLDETMVPGTQRAEELVALDDALCRLETIDQRQSQVVELRFFGGLTEEEISHILGISVRTIKRDWNVARAWLHAEMTK
jgi:RNA polymerase sigma-70 factor, ECF subfamily